MPTVSFRSMQLGPSAMRRRRTSSLAAYLTSAAFTIIVVLLEAHRASPVAYSAPSPRPCHIPGSYVSSKNDPASPPRRPPAVESAALRSSTFFHANDAQAAHRPSRPAPWPPPPPWLGRRLPPRLWSVERATTHFTGSPAAILPHNRSAASWYALQYPSVLPPSHTTACAVLPGTSHHFPDMPLSARYSASLLLLSRGVNPPPSSSLNQPTGTRRFWSSLPIVTPSLPVFIFLHFRAVIMLVHAHSANGLWAVRYFQAYQVRSAIHYSTACLCAVLPILPIATPWLPVYMLSYVRTVPTLTYAHVAYGLWTI